MSDPLPASGAPLRVLHLTLAADAGGLTRYITSLGRALVEQGVQVTAAGDSGAWDWAFERAPFPYLPLPLNRGMLGLRRSWRELAAWMADHPVDLIHTHYRRATLLARRLVRSLPGASRPPILYTLHLSHINVRGWRRWMSDFGDHTHVASRDAQAWLEQEARVAPERITVIPHGIDVNRFPQRTEQQRLTARRALGVPEAAAVAAFVGRFDHPKNETWCLDLVREGSGAPAGLHLLFAGEGPREAMLRDEARRAQAADRVHLLGHVDPLPVYQAADLLLLPSEREGFSLVCAEAMSVGVPHVRTRTSGTSELTIENETGVSVPIDRRAFAQAASALLSQPPELRRMGLAGTTLIREHFTLQRQVEQTIALYRRLCSKGAE